MNKLENCRTIKNPHILIPLLKKIDFIMKNVHKDKSNDLRAVDYDRIFMVDDQDIGHAAFYVEIRDGGHHLVGCIEIKIEIINVTTIDEVINAFIRNEECNFKIHECIAHFIRSPDLKLMFCSTNYIINQIKSIKEVKSNDRIYGIIQHNYNSGGVFFGQETIKNNIKIQRKFKSIEFTFKHISTTPEGVEYVDIWDFLKSMFCIRGRSHNQNIENNNNNNNKFL